MTTSKFKLAHTKAIKPSPKSKVSTQLKDLDDAKKYVCVHTSSDYFALPKKRRERHGWYLKPCGLPSKLFGEEEEDGWEVWKEQIRKEYPIQGWFREWFLSWDNPLYAFVQRLDKNISDAWYVFKCYFKPKHQAIRKAIPNTWSDITGLIIDVNFAMIKDFYYGEAVDGHVDWTANETHKKFYLWLKKAVKYIEEVRPQLQKDQDAAYPAYPAPKNKTYKQLYGKVNKLEMTIWKKDTELLKQMIEYRDYFWT